MTAGRQVIDATRLEGNIHATTGGLVISGNRVPLEDVAVLLLGNTASLTGGALSLLARYEVVLLNCDWRGVPDSVAYGWSHNSRVATRHRAQAELSEPRRKSAWQAIVRAKILGQQRNLEAANRVASLRVAEIRKLVRSGDSSNCEAQAARVYWDALFDDETFARIPGGDDRTNSLLNYGYTVLRGFVIQAIVAGGLWPTYGIWHRNRSNTFVLADDLIEPFRPAVDYCVLKMAPSLTLDDKAAKKELVAVSSRPMGTEGATVLTLIRDFVSQLAAYVENERDHLTPPSWAPVDDNEITFEAEDG